MPLPCPESTRFPLVRGGEGGWSGGPAQPLGNAFAIDHVECRGGEDFLKIWSHSGDGRSSVDCYANKGRTGFGSWWVDRISTGNNDLIYFDANGDSVRINRWTDITFPNRPPKVDSIEIL
ncbi:beta/gamma crystallin domain-containing protein [Streptomyces sp. NPDC001546]|uniref:beta/gamma crystallin domain-containing protein n=1 Tax=Streptomyces sp. NPDC001546 TaxID=3364585 RepID=UPI0036C8DE9E